MEPPLVRTKLMPLAQSMELPPPKPTSESIRASRAAAAPTATMAESGSWSKAWKPTTSIPPSARSARAFSTCPEATSPGSATSSVRRKPRPRASSGRRARLPGPNTMRVRGSKSKGPIRTILVQAARGRAFKALDRHHRQSAARIHGGGKSMRFGVSRWVRRGLLAVSLATPAFATDLNWPQFRGPEGQGVTRETGIALEWTDTKNVLGKTELPGRGHSSPIVWGDRIFLTTAIEGDVVPGAKAVKHIVDGEEFVHPDGIGADRKHTFKVLAHAGHRRQAGLRLLRLRGALRLRLRRDAGLGVRPRGGGDDGSGGEDIAPALQGPRDPAVRRGQRRQVARGGPGQEDGEGALAHEGPVQQRGPLAGGGEGRGRAVCGLSGEARGGGAPGRLRRRDRVARALEVSPDHEPGRRHLRDQGGTRPRGAPHEPAGRADQRLGCRLAGRIYIRGERHLFAIGAGS